MKNLIMVLFLIPNLIYCNSINEKDLAKDFDYIYKSFKKYNPEIDSLTVKNFTKVVNHYNLNKNRVDLEYLLGQILLESGAKHTYTKRYKDKFGKLVVSNTGAIGFSQILGSTGLDCMVRLLKIDDVNEFYKLGTTDFKFAYDETLTKSCKIKLTKKWLSNKDNNIIMWGFIMKYNLSKRKILKALVGYNIGMGGLRKYLRDGNELSEHHYIVGIRRRLNDIK